MKLKLALIGVVGLASGAFGQTFTTLTFNSNNIGTVGFNQVGNSYSADMLNFPILASGTDISWVFNYSTPVAYAGVRLTITGAISGDLIAVGNEKVYDTSGPSTLIASGLLDRSVSYVGPGFENFSITETYMFSQPSTVGQVQKNFLFVTPNANGWMYSIKQEFLPVPEPATLTVVGVALVGLVRRRRMR